LGSFLIILFILTQRKNILITKNYKNKKILSNHYTKNTFFEIFLPISYLTLRENAEPALRKNKSDAKEAIKVMLASYMPQK